MMHTNRRLAFLIATVVAGTLGMGPMETRPVAPAAQRAEDPVARAQVSNIASRTKRREPHIVRQVPGSNGTSLTGASPRVLFYRDYSFSNCVYERALGELGLAYTFTNSPSLFATLLVQQWDLVISANQLNDNQSTFQQPLVNFRSVNPNATMLLSDWTSSSASQYFPQLGFSFGGTTNNPSISPEPGAPLATLPAASLGNTGWNNWSFLISGGETWARNAAGQPCIARSGQTVANGFLGDTFVDPALGAAYVKAQILALSSCPPPTTQPYSASRNGTLVTNGGTVYANFTNTPAAASDVTMRFEVNADVNGGSDGVEFVLFTAGGSEQISVQITGVQCGTEVRDVTIPAATFNSARSGSGNLTFAIRTGPNTDSFCANTWKIDFSMVAVGDDCNGNGQSDACEIDRGLVSDCNLNGVPDSCDIANGTGSDCNGNGIVDACEIAGGAVSDCNLNGIPDSCDIAQGPYSASRNGTLATNGGTVYATFTGTPIAVTDVAMRFEVNADVNGGGDGIEFVLFTAGGSSRISVQITGVQCGTEVREVTIPAATFNSARTGSGDLTFAIRTGPNTDSFCANTWKIDMSMLGGSPDCNSNGRIDSCELADGTAVDQNGNGVPDSCDPFPTLVLTANAAACNAIGSVIDVDARLSGVLNLVVAGQMVLEWDPANLVLESATPGDAPYDTTYVVNSSLGQLVALVTAPPGGTGTPAPSVVVSRLRFRVLGGGCDGGGTSIGFGTYMGSLTTAFTDGVGTQIVPTLVASNGFVVDDGNPVLSNVPADVSVQAFAGEGGYALVPIGTPTASDACAPGLAATGVRSDGQALGAAWPSGTTVVTWTAADPCGNTSVAYTSVTVNPTNTIDLAAEWGSGFTGATRTLSVTVLGTTGSQSRNVSVGIPAGGSSAFAIDDLPVDDYSCATIEDQARSLRARVAVSDGGVAWIAAGAAMVLGDIINDEVIDVLDWGAYVVTNPNADLNGDGSIGPADGNIILANFGRRGDLPCGVGFAGSPDPVTSITVAELAVRGLGQLAAADLNGDGVLDGADIDRFMDGH